MVNTLFTRKFHHQGQKGFTLIELLVTISIIGVLSALLITNLVGARTRAADSQKKAELQQLKSALRLYYNDYQSYPSGSGLIDPAGGSEATPGTPFAVGSTVYMKTTPANYTYYSDPPNDQFLLYVQLSNTSDTEIQKNFARCCSSMRTGCPSSTTDGYILCED